MRGTAPMWPPAAGGAASYSPMRPSIRLLVGAAIYSLFPARRVRPCSWNRSDAATCRPALLVRGASYSLMQPSIHLRKSVVGPSVCVEPLRCGPLPTRVVRWRKVRWTATYPIRSQVAYSRPCIGGGFWLIPGPRQSWGLNTTPHTPASHRCGHLFTCRRALEVGWTICSPLRPSIHR